ncbi:cardiolipin synthase [Thiorhodococcus mannitoliphagus]|uniref:Cardiolipin synthase n=1 Tax=Thiorhodococcus mannitoliphagus TaxID=329406 RepID=A0A6P1E1F3_9GAMM|nr:phospholipase D-like domain-containing protein [Thiorhodococcus mannitoliphagus]NEX23151.1 cardiolipin synthase [Thiorhodococcus mannitoliphagus]
MWQFLDNYWVALLILIGVVAQVGTTLHLLLNRRDSASTVGWAALVSLAPLTGFALYWVFGINRIERKAHRLRPAGSRISQRMEMALEHCAHERLGLLGPQLIQLGKLGDAVTGAPLEAGNRVDPLYGGDHAYPEMLAAIDAAQHSIALSTYIFDNDELGRGFARALKRAQARGVEVRVLIDGVGQRYSSPPMGSMLRELGIRAALFLAPSLPIRSQYLNLRNHRKILAVDGRMAFTGGLNIRIGSMLSAHPKHPVEDLHFRIEGPVVRFLVEAFAVDWHFTTGERLCGDSWYPQLRPAGDSLVRGVPDGPDEDFDNIRRMMLGALSAAQERVRIVSPYFLPDQTLITTLNLTAMRGVEVDILMPAKNNLRFVQWAAQDQADLLLAGGCRLWLTPPPFDHTKLMLVDDVWSFFGSANWDARSLRLNFEYNLECYDADLSARLHRLVDSKLAGAQQLTLDQVCTRSLPLYLRGAFARLFAPYL